MYGLIEGIADLRAYVLGSSTVPFVPYQEDGNWEPYLPQYESQSNRFETRGCTVWGLQNQVETFIKRLYNVEPNYSERFNYLLVPVVPARGADPQDAYECVREHGLIEQELMPMTSSLEAFLDTSDLTGSLRARGLYWLKTHDFRHEWLWAYQPENWKYILRQALVSSPIAVSVHAWKNVGGEYVGGPNNHWCLLYKIDDDGSMWVFDSYDHSKKKLHKDHSIKRAKRIWINRKTTSGARKHISLLQAIINRLMQKPNLVDVCKAALGTDPSPRDYAPDDVACAESMTTLMKKVYPETPIITGTATLQEYLDDPKNGWKRVALPTPGTIVLSPTGSGEGTGHVGIYLDNNLIASNDSGLVIRTNRGKFLENYTTDTWLRRFRERQKMPVYLYNRA